MVRFIQLVAGATLIFGTAAAAQPSEFAESVMNTCRPDAGRVCADVEPGKGRVARCLLKHERELAPACLRGIKLAYALEMCKADYQRVCGGVPEGVRGVECLAGKLAELPPDCQRAVTASTAYINGPAERYGYNNPRQPGPYTEPYSGPYSYRGPARDSDWLFGWDRDRREEPSYAGRPPYGYGPPYAGPPNYPDRSPYAGPPSYSDRSPYAGSPNYPDRPPYADRAPDGGPQPYDGRYADRDYDRNRYQPYGEAPEEGAPEEQAPYSEQSPPYGGRYYDGNPQAYPPQGSR